MAENEQSQRIEAVRRFNRFYTQQIGVLDEGLLNSPFSLTEARVIYELAHSEKSTATELGNRLTLDMGYLSRIITGFKKRGLVESMPSETDGRQQVLQLTESGQQEAAELSVRSRNQIAEILDRLSKEDQQNLIGAMQKIEQLLGARAEQRVPFILRPHQPGDMGWVVYRHGLLYAEEYKWDERFEGLVAAVVAEFIQKFDHRRERCWIAEMNGEIVGSVFLVKKSDSVAKLRLLLVEPKARGLGIGSRLVDECIRFARQTGYQKITLWTNHVLMAARQIYQKAGFQLVESEAHDMFGKDLIGETWELDLK